MTAPIPQAPRAPSTAPRWWDGLLVGLLLTVGLTRIVLESPADGSGPWTAVRVCALLALPWRRRHPVAMISLGFAVASLGALGQLASRGAADPPDVTAALLLLPHALGRWTTGRQLALGIVFAAALVSVSLVAEGLTPAEMAGAAGVLATPLAMGISGRLRARIREQALEQAQLGERHRLGRQLDDVVAHRLVAIVIRAQTEAGDPDESRARAIEALRDIETEASRCLTEMRELVRLLRQGEDERAPHTSRAERETQNKLHKTSQGKEPK